MGRTVVRMLVAAVVFALCQDPTPLLTSEAARADVALLRRALDEIHPGTTRYAKAEELERAFAELDKNLAAGITSGALYLELSRLVGLVRCGHSRVEAPALEEHRATHPTHLPFAFRWLEGRMVVTAVDASAVGLARGDEVRTLDGVAVGELVTRLAPLMPLDGWTDPARASRLDTPYEWEDSGFDHYLPLVHGFRASFVLGLRASDGQERSVTVPALTSDAARKLRPAGVSDFARAVTTRDLDATTALLTVETFVNYRTPVEPERVYAPLFEGFLARGIEHLVVDLRANGGGSDDAAWALGRFLAREPFTPAARPPRVKRIRFGELVPHLETWETGAFDAPAELFTQLDDGWFEFKTPPEPPLEPHPAAFPGRITILTGPFNASGTTMLLAVLREHAELRLVGEPTAGSAEGPTAGLIFFLTLPASGIRVNIPVYSQRTSATRIEPGLGVTPDVLVPETVADLLAGRDAALAAALR